MRLLVLPVGNVDGENREQGGDKGGGVLEEKFRFHSSIVMLADTKTSQNVRNPSGVSF